MRDPCLSIISALLLSPDMPLKFYLGVSKMSRGTFFKAKAELESRGIVFYTGSKQLTLDRDKALDFIVVAYPGLPSAYGTHLQAVGSAQTYGLYANLSNGAGN